MSARDLPVTLITGGAGFIGTNLAERLLLAGQRVLILDNLSRAGVRANLNWLREQFGAQVQVDVNDVRDRDAVLQAVGRADHIYHFAAQVAVTTSLEDPRADFETNAMGTLNVLEAMRQCGSSAPLLLTSTNKVYGSLDDVELRREADRYVPVSYSLRHKGVDEARGLDFHSPYGCSKGAADQYVLDYARSYGLRAVVFRMSCIYGPHQFGNEDQGWVAHFLIQARDGRPIVIYGDGCQVRDVLYVGDLVDALMLASTGIEALSGRAFNIGGGPSNTLSLLELVAQIERCLSRPVDLQFASWRRGDQRYYVSDTGQFELATGWRARTSPADGVAQLQSWLNQMTPAHVERRTESASQAVHS
jgi:CDP-paratose 2-epimerase